MLLATLQISEKRAYEKHSIDVVYISVLPTVVMDIIPGHRDFWTIEDRWLEGSTNSVRANAVVSPKYLVHVVPDVNRLGALCPRPPATRKLVGLEE